MKILIRSAKIVDPESSYNGKVKDILIEKGKIIKVGKNLDPGKGNTKTFKAKNLHISPGWFDMRVNFRDPGEEQKEDIISGIKAAIAGGMTGVAVFPSTTPPIHTKSDVEYVKTKSTGKLVDVYPVAAISHNLEGERLAEIHDMYTAGAVAFSDDIYPIKDPGLLSRALLYVKNFNGLIVNRPADRQISPEGQVNEGPTSTSLGLKGIPALAEELMAVRDLYIAEYTESRIHLSTISTSETAKLIKDAKARGIKVTCEVAAHHLMLDDTLVDTFDSNFKTDPPLRDRKCIKDLIRALKENTIDVICSDHSPQDEESKKTEFDHADYGIVGLTTLFPVANTVLKKSMSIDDIIRKIAINPRTILDIPVPKIEEDEMANLTLFDPDLQWEFTQKHIASRSANTPFLGTKFTGRALAVINKGMFEECL